MSCPWQILLLPPLPSVKLGWVWDGRGLPTSPVCCQSIFATRADHLTEISTVVGVWLPSDGKVNIVNQLHFYTCWHFLFSMTAESSEVLSLHVFGSLVIAFNFLIGKFLLHSRSQELEDLGWNPIGKPHWTQKGFLLNKHASNCAAYATLYFLKIQMFQIAFSHVWFFKIRYHFKKFKMKESPFIFRLAETPYLCPCITCFVQETVTPENMDSGFLNKYTESWPICLDTLGCSRQRKKPSLSLWGIQEFTIY